MKISTDPVELWAGPHSRSRAEKDFFDDKFGPFYRTAQVFIKPVNKENVTFRSPNNTTDSFLSLFLKCFFSFRLRMTQSMELW